MDSKTKTRLIVLTMVTVILLMLVSFGYFYTSSNQNDRDRLTGGCFNTSFIDGDSISIVNAFPESFEDSKGEEPYDFTITNTCSLPAKYYIILNVKTGSFNPDFINYSINNTGENRLYNAPLNNNRFSIDDGYNKSFIIGSGLLKTGSKTESIRLWIDKNVNPSDLTTNSNFIAQIKVVGEVSSQLATDKILNLVQGEQANTLDVITKSAPSGETCTNTLAYDGTVDNNLRYVGVDPCNYVSFNNELWRIIGVMNNVDDGTGNLETRIKLIRKDPIGNYSWDTSENNINSGYGINEWTQADLMNELNGDYLDTKLESNTMWYNGRNNSRSGIYDYTKVLNPASQGLINNAKWNLGGKDTSTYKVNEFYTAERSSTVFGSIDGQACNDGYCPRATEWTGKIALMYLSDYGFATGGAFRNVCLQNDIPDYNEDCFNNNWIYSSNYQWTLTPNSHLASLSFRIPTLQQYVYTDSLFSVRPSIYLNSNVSITGGNGSITNPYTLG